MPPRQQCVLRLQSPPAAQPACRRRRRRRQVGCCMVDVSGADVEGLDDCWEPGRQNRAWELFIAVRSPGGGRPAALLLAPCMRPLPPERPFARACLPPARPPLPSRPHIRRSHALHACHPPSPPTHRAGAHHGGRVLRGHRSLRGGGHGAGRPARAGAASLARLALHLCRQARARAREGRGLLPCCRLRLLWWWPRPLLLPLDACCPASISAAG